MEEAERERRELSYNSPMETNFQKERTKLIGPVLSRYCIARRVSMYIPLVRVYAHMASIFLFRPTRYWRPFSIFEIALAWGRPWDLYIFQWKTYCKNQVCVKNWLFGKNFKLHHFLGFVGPPILGRMSSIVKLVSLSGLIITTTE